MPSRRSLPKHSRRCGHERGAVSAEAGVALALPQRATGAPLPILHNAVEALRGDPAIQDAYAFDEMLCIPMLMHTIGAPLDHIDPRPVSDSDVTELQRWMQAVGLARIARETVRDALSFRAAELAYHPIREYLESAQWDGRPRVNLRLTTKLGAEMTPYTQAVGRMFLIAMVARISSLGARPITCSSWRVSKARSKVQPAPYSAVNGFLTTCRMSLPARTYLSTCAANGSSKYPKCTQ